MAEEEQDFVVLDATDYQGFNDEGILPLSAKEVSEIQTWLAPTDYKSSEYRKHSLAHLAGTGTWILHTDQYRLWHDSDRGALWIKAIAGAGKSVIAASLTTKLAAEEGVPVLYFFFRHIISANQKPQSLVRDYMSQVLEYSPTLQQKLYKLVHDQRALDSVSLDELWKMLVLAVTRLPRVYCVADALDEMDAGNEFFLQDLVTLAQKAPKAVKVLMTSRPVPRLEQVLRHPSVLQIILQPRLVDPDISAYVQHRVSSCQISEKLRSQIHETMCAQADGHFLYARLMMDDLLEPSKNLLSCEKDMVAALNRLPTPMADMYTQMLLDHSRLSGVPQELQLTLLQWVTRSERPLRLLELSSMIDFEQKALDMSKDTKSVVREGCGPLLEILEDETVCPIHHSFTEYLYDQERLYVGLEAAKFPVLDQEEAQHAIAVTCVRYLASGWHRDWQRDAGDDPSRDKRNTRSLKLKYPFLDYAANNWHQHVRKSNTKAAAVSPEIDCLFAGDPKILPTWLELTAERPSPFDYIKANTFNTWSTLHAAADKGLRNYVEYLIGKGHDVECLNLEEHTPLALAAKNGHAEIVVVLLRNGAKNDEADHIGLKPLHHAATRNHHGVAKLLLESGVDAYTKKTKENPGGRCGNAPTSIGDTPVEYTCHNGHVETIKAFIPHLQGDGLHRALYWALRFDQSKVAMAILEAPGIDVNFVNSDQTPLYLASHTRNVGVMRLLLDMGADAHALSSDYMFYGVHSFQPSRYERRLNPLQAFARANGCDDSIVMKKGFAMLLDAGLDPNTAGPGGATILHDILRSEEELTEDEYGRDIEGALSLLLDRGLSATTLMVDGSNALHVASKLSTMAIDMLLSRGVDIDKVRESDGKTPLMTALDSYDLIMAQNLLNRGADANLSDSEGNTPLHFIAKLHDYEEVLEITKALIAVGADVNGRNKDGNTPIHIGDIKASLLSLFLEHGYDLEAKNKKGNTLLFQSIAGQSFSKSYKKLVELGASPLTRDCQGSSVLHAILNDSRENGTRTTDVVRYFVEKGVDPLTTDNSGNTLWHVVANLGAIYNTKEQVAVMRLLVDYNVPPMARNYAGQTPLHVAFSVGAYSSIEFLLREIGVDINVADYDRIRPIHLTSSCDPVLACHLLELGADPTTLTVEGQSPLMVACRTRQCSIVQILLEHHREHKQLLVINQLDNQGRSALHYACKSGIPENVALLLEAGANADIKDKHGHTPLHACAEYLNEQASWDKAESLHHSHRSPKAAYVLSTDPSRPRVTATPREPIRIRETIRLLIANGADTSFLTQEPSDSFPEKCPLEDAISNGCSAVVSELQFAQNRLLKARFSDAEKSTASTETSINKAKEGIDVVKVHWASILGTFHNRTRLVTMWYMPDIVAETIRPGENNANIVKELLNEDDEPAIEQVYKLGARFLELDYSGDNPLYEMASRGFTHLMRRVGQDAARMNVAWTKEMVTLNVDWKEGRLKPILYTALERELPNMAMVKLLVSEFKLDINEQFPDGSYEPNHQSFVHVVASSRYWWHTKALEFLLQNGADPEALNTKQETPLIVALRGSYEPMRSKVVEILLVHGANPNVVDKEGLTCLNLAAGGQSCIKLLLKHGANPSLGQRSFIFDTIIAQDLSTLHTIVDIGADVNALAQSSPKGDKVPKTWREIRDVNFLSERAYPIHVAASHFFNTPQKMMRAVEIIKLLLGAGADPSRVYKDGNSIMHVLAKQGGIMEPFFDHASFDTESRDRQGRTLLLAACDSSPYIQHAPEVTLPFLLLKHGASPTAVDYDGRNALHCLISALPKECGFHTIFMAMSKPFLPTLVPTSDLQGRTPFHYAVAASRFDLIDLLISHGADPLSHDPLDGNTALHHLATGFPDQEDVLLHDPGAIITAETVAKFAVELSLDVYHDEALCQIVRTKVLTAERLVDAELRSPRRHFAELLASGLSIEARDNAGETPLFRLVTCVLHDTHGKRCGLFPALKAFEVIGADFRVRNKSGESVLHKLATRENPQGRWGRDTDKDAREDYKKSFRWLVEKGVDVSWEDEGNRTCLDVAASAGAGWALEMYMRK